MNELKHVKFEELLPSNLREDAGVLNAARSLDAEFTAVTEAIKECALIARIDELPEQLIDLLAWQWHVDFYDYHLTLNIKRNLVKESLDWHRIKGTPAAIEKVVTTAFKSAVVREWYDYGAEPYYFKVEMIKEGMPDLATLNSLIKSIEAAKNVRSWLDEISFRREVDCTIFMSDVKNIFRSISIYPPKIKLPEFINTQYLGGSQYIHKEVNVYA